MLTLSEIFIDYGRAAQAICWEIDQFQPDLVMGLMHGGRPALEAAQLLWRLSRDVDFPTVVWANIGREKQEVHFKWCFAQGLPSVFNGEYANDVDIGRYLAWIREQHRWQVELRNMVAEAQGAPSVPARVLVVDEFSADGTTWIMALGIVRSTYPGVDARYVSANVAGRAEFPRFWLQRFHPGILSCMHERAARIDKTNWNEWKKDPLAWLHVAGLGTEDLDDEMSLYWRDISEDSQNLGPLVEYLPPGEWLKIRPWVTAQIGNAVAKRASQMSLATRQPDRPLWVRTLSQGCLISQFVWENGYTTVEEVSSVFGTSLDEAQRQLDEQVSFESLMLVGKLYTLPRGIFEEPWDATIEAK